MTLDKIIKVCIHQYMKPDYIPVPKETRPYCHGDCNICKYDPIENPKCKGYYGIFLNGYEVE